MKLNNENIVSFSNVTVLKLCTNFPSVENLDLRGLKHLKSLELESNLYWASLKRSVSIVGLRSLSKLVFLRWLGIPSNLSCIDEIGYLTKLQVLDLCGCGRWPDISKLVSLQVVCFRDSELVATIPGFNSKHTNLQFLNLSNCRALQSCWGLSELVTLHELCLNWCSQLKEVPNLQKLKCLRKLHVKGCWLLPALLGLGDLFNLLELHAILCYSLVELPNICNLKNLRILNIDYCKLIKSLPGLDELVCLQSLQTLGCENLSQLPDMYKLTNLQSLKLDPKVPIQSFTGWSNLISLWSLRVGMDEGLLYANLQS